MIGYSFHWTARMRCEIWVGPGVANPNLAAHSGGFTGSSNHSFQGQKYNLYMEWVVRTSSESTRMKCEIWVGHRGGL